MATDFSVSSVRAMELNSSTLDTATVYRNEEAVGKLLKEQMNQHNINRNEIFVTSKLGNLYLLTIFSFY